MRNLRLKLVLWSSILLSSLPLAGQDLNAGRVVHYPFDETSGTTVLDASGNNRNGTLVGGPQRLNGTLVFNGGSFVEALNIQGLHTPSMTKCMMDVTQTVSETARIAVDANGTTTVVALGIVGQGPTSARFFFHRLYSDGLAVWETAVGSAYLTTKYSICVDYDNTPGSNPVFRLNGQVLPIQETTHRFGTPVNTANKIVLASRPESNGGFKGSFGEYRHYNRRLSGAEFTQLFSGTVPPPPPPPPPPTNQPPTVTCQLSPAAGTVVLPQSGTFSALAQDDGLGGALSYLWIVAFTTSAPLNTPTLNPTDLPAGRYDSVKVRVSDSQHSVEATCPVLTVVPAPKVLIEGITHVIKTNGALRVELYVGADQSPVDIQMVRPTGGTLAEDAQLSWRQGEIIQSGVHTLRIVRCPMRDPLPTERGQCTEETISVQVRSR